MDLQKRDAVAKAAKNQGFDMCDLQRLKDDVVEKIVNANGIFQTKLTLEDIRECFQRLSTLRESGGSEGYKNNALLKNEELMTVCQELVEKEKPTPDMLGWNQARSSQTPHVKWFSSGKFLRQYSRYCYLSRAYKELAVSKFRHCIETPGAKLFGPERALVKHWLDVMGFYDPGFGVTDLATGRLGEFLTWTGLCARFACNIPNSSHYLVLLQQLVLTCYMVTNDLAGNALATGDGATSKSHVTGTVIGMLVDGSYLELDGQSKCALNSEDSCCNCPVIYDEGDVTALDPFTQGLLRRYATSGKLTRAVMEFLTDPVTGEKRKRITRIYVTIIRAMLIMNCNGDFFTEATKTRFLNAPFVKVAPRKGNQLNGVKKRYISRAKSKLLQNSSAAVRRVKRFFKGFASEKSREDGRLMRKRRVLSMIHNRDVDSELSNELPESNVTQAMFVENFVGNGQFGDDSKTFFANRTRDNQTLVFLVANMIKSKCMTMPNMLVAHLTLQKYFGCLKEHYGLDMANYRVYWRAVVLCRILTIENALFQAFGSPGSDLPPNSKLTIESLMACEPYLFCTLETAVAGISMLHKEHVHPQRNTVMRILGNVLCKAPSAEYYEDISSSWHSLLGFLKAVDAKVQTPAQLMRAVRVAEARVKKMGIFLKKEGIRSGSEAPTQAAVRAFFPLPPVGSFSAIAAGDATANAPQTSPSEEEEALDLCDDGDLSETEIAQRHSSMHGNGATCDDGYDEPSESERDEKDDEVVETTDSAEGAMDDYLVETLTDVFSCRCPAHQIFAASNAKQLPKSPIWYYKDTEMVDGSGNDDPARADMSNKNLNRLRYYDCNYVCHDNSLTHVVLAVKALMVAEGLSLADCEIKNLLSAMAGQKIKVPVSYANMFTASEIGNMKGKTQAQLIAEGVLVRDRSYEVVKIENGAQGAGHKGWRVSFCVHMLGRLHDPQDMIKEALKSVLYKGVKPGRYVTGYMANENRGAFDYWDVTEKDLERAPDALVVQTGSFMTTRERAVMRGTLSNEEEESEEDVAAAEIESEREQADDEAMAEMFGQRWVENLLKKGEGGVNQIDVLSIREDIDEFAVKIHFMNCGIQMGPHPSHPRALCWYYRPWKKRDDEWKVDDVDVEFREFPTGWVQRMRTLNHARKDREFEKRLRKKGIWDEEWAWACERHYASRFVGSSEEDNPKKRPIGDGEDIRNTRTRYQ